MKTTMTFTEEQFKQSIIDTFRQQIAQTPNVTPANLSLDSLKFTVYTTDDPNIPRQIDELIIDIEF